MKTEQVYCFSRDQSLSHFQKLIAHVYGLPDDRLYSIWDLLTQQQRFTMRALKGIRKNDPQKVTKNLLIAFSWLMAIANRLHVDLEKKVWERFPGVCSYCGNQPCSCRKIKPAGRKKLKIDISLRPKTLHENQALFQKIYPVAARTLSEAGVHLAEEMGEVSEAIHNYLGQHTAKLFEQIILEMADYVSCIFGVANSLELDMAKELEKMYTANCHICHKVPCECSFAFVAGLST